MKNNKPYFLQSFLIILLSAVLFIGLKDFLPKKIFSEKSNNSKNILIDSMLIDAFEAEKEDTTITIGETLINQKITHFENNGISFPDENFDDYNGYQNLISFYEKLYQLENTKTGNVRIAYFGDSMTDGDLIVQDVRAQYQNKFGGKGVGFVPITSESAASRGSILHEYSKNWKMQSYLNVKKPIRPFAVNGHVFFANDTINNPWVKFRASKIVKKYKLYSPTLFYGNSNNQTGFISYVIGKDTLRKKLAINNLLNTMVLSNNTLNLLKVNFKKASKIPIYGFNFDDGEGIHVDNFSQRGNSGIPISKFNIDLMQAFHAKLDYDLIVLHYGTNVLNYGTKDYAWYDKSMTKTVNRLRESFPGTSILIVSTADKATKYDLEMKTDSAVVPLTLTQKQYAIKTQSGFVNLYKLMGGDGSMIKWVEGEVSLAGKDYTHFNQRGAKKIAGMLFEQMDKGYEQYKMMRKKQEEEIKIQEQKAKLATDTIITNVEKTDE